MKKAIIFAIAITLSGSAFAGNLEDFKSKSGLASLDAKTIANTEILIPAALQKIDIGITKAKDSGYHLHSDGICKNAAGEEGYNKITATELIKNPKKGECADLRNANLSGANLQKANLKGANLSEANLDKSNLSKANLTKATLSGAKLYKADLSMANLNMANLHNAYLVKTNMAKANLQEAILRRAYLTRANLNGANLRESDLSEAYMHKTDLKDTDLRMADLRGTILKETNLKNAKHLRRAKYNNRTQLPFSKDEAYHRGMIKVAN